MYVRLSGFVLSYSTLSISISISDVNETEMMTTNESLNNRIVKNMMMAAYKLKS